MAAVTSSPPQTSAASNPSLRKPVPGHNQLPEPYQAWEDGSKRVARKPISNVPLHNDARLRDPPKSPVRVNFQEGNWPQPSNANIETSPYALEPPQLHLSALSLDDRDLPQTPDAPPPHSPPNQSHNQYTPMEHAPRQQPVPIGGLPPLPSNVASASSQGSRPVPGPHTGLDFGFDKTALSSEHVLSPTSADAPSTDPNRHSRDTDTTTSINQHHTPQSSATTSASSVSYVNDPVETQTHSTQSPSGDGSPESSIIEGGLENSVPALQYHHQAFLPPRAASATYDARAASNPDLAAEDMNTNRHLTPSIRRTSLPRPQSAYSAYSDLGPRGRSPGLLGGSHIRAPSAHSRKSPDTRPSSYAELLNVPYPQPAPAPITFDNSQLRNNVGSNASLLSTQKTLEMYRQNVKKTNDFSIQYSFAVFLIATAQEQGLSFDESSKRRNNPKPMRDHDSPYIEGSSSSPRDLVKEAKAILTKLASNGYPFAQYYLADGYASGLFNKGKEDNNSAFPLFVYAAKHGHAESAYRAALCYEFGWGCRKDPAKAVQFLRTAASKRHPGAMTRLGKACLSGDLGERKYREGIKWLKLASEAADAIYNAAPYQLGCLYETGYGDDVFQDESYAAELFTQAAELGHPEANYRMGDAYEHGKLNCPRDPALSVHFYTGAAERGHAAAMMGLCAWYMVGAEPILEKDEEEAYEWARRSAELGYVKAQYAVGYFTEMGIGCRRDMLEANVWYVKAADAGDDRAKHRLAAIRAAASGGTPMDVAPPRNGKIKKGDDGKGDCVVM